MLATPNMVMDFFHSLERCMLSLDLSLELSSDLSSVESKICLKLSIALKSFLWDLFIHLLIFL